MAGRWCDPFDEYPDTAHMLDGVYANVGSSWSLSTANPCTGTKSFRLTTGIFILDGGINAAMTARRIFGVPLLSAGVAYHLYLPELPPTDTGRVSECSEALQLMVFLDASGIPQVTLRCGTDGSVIAYRGCNATISAFSYNNETLLARSNPCITAKTYNHIEALVHCDVLGGAVEVRVNGVTVLNIAGVNTDFSGAAEVSQVLMGLFANETDNNIGAIDFDDLHAWDTIGASPTDFVGNSAVIYRAPSADTATADWAATPGLPAYPLLDDNLDTTYISAPNVGERSAFLFADLPASVQGVIYQQLNWRGIKLNAGDCDVTPYFVSGGAEEDSAPVPMTTAETWRWAIQPEDPATSGAPWTPASANASEGAFLRSL